MLHFAYLMSVGEHLHASYASWYTIICVQAEKEPILSSFFYATILSHDCLEQALAFALANRLQNPTLLATQLMDIFSNVMKHDKGIQQSIRLDIQVTYAL